MIRCPICKMPLTINYFESDSCETFEKRENCQEGCKQYSYEYAYGSWRTLLGNTEFDGWYGETKTKRKNNYFIYMRKLERLRKAYKRKNY